MAVLVVVVGLHEVDEVAIVQAPVSVFVPLFADEFDVVRVEAEAEALEGVSELVGAEPGVVCVCVCVCVCPDEY